YANVVTSDPTIMIGHSNAVVPCVAPDPDTRNATSTPPPTSTPTTGIHRRKPRAGRAAGTGRGAATAISSSSQTPGSVLRAGRTNATVAVSTDTRRTVGS